jgi:hypothetical protein
MSEIIKLFKFFWPWQDQEQEKWLKEKSQTGLHLKKPNNLMGIYTFEKGEPQVFTYRLDFQSDLKNNKETYIQIFEDAGWEYLGESSWQYFRKPDQKETSNEIFTDNQSKIKKYERLVLYQSIFVVIFTMLFIVGGDLEGDLAWLSHLFTGFFIPSAILFIVSILTILDRIKNLKEEVND